MAKNIKDNAGVSLIEVIISMFIVSMLLIAIVAVFPRMMQHRKGIHESDQARIVAAEVLEGLQLMTAHPSYSCDNFPAADSGGRLANILRDREIGAVTYEVVIEPELIKCPDPATRINTIGVTVKWNRGGKDHRVTVVGALR